MRFIDMLAQAGAHNHSMLCVGLDPDPGRFPAALRGKPDGIYAFCAAIVDATHDLVCAFKPQIAHFAAHRAEAQLERLIAHMRRTAPHVPVILDAKRGDIGSTARLYAQEAFTRYAADAVTVSPWLGLDSIAPYLEYRDKGIFLLCRTSNPGSDDLQAQRLAGVAGTPPLFEHVARLAQGACNAPGQIGLVVGATRAHDIARVRACAPALPLLIPGVGAQGGDAQAAVRAARGPHGNARIIVNASRAVLYAAPADASVADFAAAARAAAEATRALLNGAAGS